MDIEKSLPSELDWEKADYFLARVAIEQIAREISAGCFLSEVCAEAGYPTVYQVHQWKRKYQDLYTTLDQAFLDRELFYQIKAKESEKEFCEDMSLEAERSAKVYRWASRLMNPDVLAPVEGY